MDEERSNVNQTNNNVIKNARGARRGWGSNAKCTKPEKGPTLYAKSGEFVTPNGGAGDARG